MSKLKVSLLGLLGRETRQAKEAYKRAGSRAEMDKVRKKRDKGKSIEQLQKEAMARIKRGKMR